MKVEKVGLEAVEKFKIYDEYSNKLCNYYVEGLELCRKYLAKHHPDLDFSKLNMEAIEKEILADHQSTKGAVEGGEAVAIDKAASIDPIYFALEHYFFFFFFFNNLSGSSILSKLILF